MQTADRVPWLIHQDVHRPRRLSCFGALQVPQRGLKLAWSLRVETYSRIDHGRGVAPKLRSVDKSRRFDRMVLQVAIPDKAKSGLVGSKTR